MDLILWRHADAEEAAAGQADLERRLSARGERQAQRMAKWLARQLPEGTLILASPAVRAQDTVAALGRDLRTLVELGPAASAQTLLALAGWPDAKGAVLVVGHQPALGRAAALALTGQAADWSIRKGAVWWLKSRDREGPQGRAIHCVQSPETL